MQSIRIFVGTLFAETTVREVETAGIVVGIALIVATTIAAYARITVEDSKKLLAPEFYPSWVAAYELIKANLEPTLEQYRPMVLSSLSFSKFTLGTVAPQFTGVSIIDDGSEGITMEMEMNWHGNRSIILDIETRLGVGLPVQIDMRSNGC
ncbi:hypothetical protein L2E82_02927 [Cichorium intybus]|uniref:Uncharacterized protein n=1 Tax=Cichorium intybus TaxID=13427 RepID=A0ACB9H452_CICIN|nr:hypothetical protein L2E82_02927 [Cichorium intybus]